MHLHSAQPMMRPLFAVMLLAFLPACVTTLKAEMNSWVSKDEATLVSEWGAPARSADLPDGGKVLTGVRDFQTSDDPAGHQTGRCERSFTLSPQRIVTKWAAHGCPAVYGK